LAVKKKNRLFRAGEFESEGRADDSTTDNNDVIALHDSILPQSFRQRLEGKAGERTFTAGKTCLGGL
jgi:hypothetical protein